MCAIIGSKWTNIDQILELIEMNKYRGTFSFSICGIGLNSKSLKFLIQGFDFPDFKSYFDNIDLTDCYIIIHLQAPTNGLTKDLERVHPAKVHQKLLYHNGIIKTAQVEKLEEQFGRRFNWDTMALATVVENGGFKELSNIDGSFACVYIQPYHDIYLFRNYSSILYINDDLTISSTKFEGSRELDINKVFALDFEENKLKLEYEFQNIDNSYFFID